MNFTNRIKALFSRSITLGNSSSIPSNEAGQSFFGFHPQVSYEAIMGYAPTRRCVLLLAEMAASLTANVFIRDEKEGRVKDTDSWAWWLLNKQPCEWLSPIQWKTQYFVYYLIYQNAYAYIHRDNNGNPIRKTLIYPWSMGRNIDWDTGIPSYSITMPITGEKLVNVPHTDIFHLKGPGDMYEGYSLLQIAKQGLEKSLNLQNYASKFFKHDGYGRTIVKIPLTDATHKDKAEEYIRNYRQQYEGPENAHKTIFAGTGTDISKQDVDADKMQMIESQAHDLVLSAALFGIPASYIGAAINTSYGSLEQESRTLVKSLNPMLIQFEQEASKKLLTSGEYNFSRKYVELNRNELIEIEIEKQKQILQDQYHGNLISFEEARELENRSTVKDYSQHWLRPANIVPDTGDEPIPPPAPVQQPEKPVEPTQDTEGDKVDQTAMKLTKGIMQRFGERVGKLKQPLEKHKEHLLEQLEAWEGSEHFVDILFCELAEVLPEQRQSIIENYPLEALCV